MAATEERADEDKPNRPDTEAAANEDGDAEQKPQPDPATCGGLALCQSHLMDSILEHEWDDTDFLYYLEPAGVLNAKLLCVRCHPDEERRAGIWLTKASRDTRTVFFDDGINPDRYELHVPKEIGYLKSRQHYEPEAREHAKYPWTKKY